MLHEWVKIKIYLPLGSQKIKNGYLGICSDGFHFLSLWQMMPKIIDFFFFFMFIVNVTWICQHKKIVMYMGSQKFTNGYLGIHTNGLNLPMLIIYVN